MTLLRYRNACLSKSRPYAGNSVDPRVPPTGGKNLEVRTIRREGRCRKTSEPSETVRRSPPMFGGEDKVRPSRRREEVARNRGPPFPRIRERSRKQQSERNTLSL